MSSGVKRDTEFGLKAAVGIFVTVYRLWLRNKFITQKHTIFILLYLSQYICETQKPKAVCIFE